MKRSKKFKVGSDKIVAFLTAVVLFAECGKSIIELFSKKGKKK